MKNTGFLVLIIGPSGVGKSVIMSRLKKMYPEYHFPRSITTRKKRPNEGDDIYHFVTDQEFDEYIQNNLLLEYAVVHQFARYGTLIPEIVPPMQAGKIVIREVDVQGFYSIRQHALFAGAAPLYQVKSIFIEPESTDQLIKHITKRAPITDDELEKRIASIQHECLVAAECTVRIVNMEGKIHDTIQKVIATLDSFKQS